jgi:triosephosphate isomerase
LNPSGRRPLLAGNWKMNKTSGEGRELAREIIAAGIPPEVDVVVAPPFTALAAVAEEVLGSPVALGAQNMHEAAAGPFTGEVSAPMLRDLGVAYVILGHSERREYFNETDAAVARKVRSALDFGLIPIVCVGETAAEHAAGVTVEKVVRQARAAFASVSADEAGRCVVAYEPIWAIGTGNVDTPESADGVMGAIRACVPGLSSARILYGGSMKPENAGALMARPNIDGGLIGGASLSSHPILACIAAARPEPA